MFELETREKELNKWDNIYNTSEKGIDYYLEFAPYENKKYKIKGLIVYPKLDEKDRKNYAASYKSVFGNSIDTMNESRRINRNKYCCYWKYDLVKFYNRECDMNWKCGSVNHPLVPRKVVIPKEYNGIPVVAIKFFNDLWELEEIELPETIREIYPDCFNNAKYLTKVTNIDKAIVIGDSSFNKCESLIIDWDKDVSKQLESLGSYCFGDCKKVINFSPDKLQNSLKELPKYNIFSLYYDKIKPEDIPEYTGEFVFPSKVKTTGNMLIRKSCHFTSVKLPEKLTKIGISTFKDWENITSVFIPKSVKVIDKFAFCDCKNLKSVIFEDGSKIKQIKANAFLGCENLEFIDWGKGDAEYLEKIEEGAFMSCYKLKSITLPKNLIKLGDSTFYKCGLTSIEIPEKINIIPTYCFGYCENLEYVEFKSSENTIINKGVFRDCFKLKELKGLHGIVPTSAFPENFIDKNKILKMSLDGKHIEDVIIFSD